MQHDHVMMERRARPRMDARRSAVKREVRCVMIWSGSRTEKERERWCMRVKVMALKFGEGESDFVGMP